ncbi:putative ribosomal N-acetyltransferase YdaF [Meiothermus luteus]|uniref:Putative ribosomal N-acetyltransferase YdaF n=1 Tax=Meiothermus luteus TaxID=2026184 RepID=A0A399EWU8_9DEIN|nr:GNAT family protein [Meiothermus luteus]RIH88488.1 putative ribosomal N-acetyltransferase YdaF [Meiothermus luteus]RMH57315.1 MAG: GNAT family N-acetyltransferase [Deinococcota bacterium]
MELQGPRVRLRPPRPEDTLPLFALMSDPALAPWVYWSPPQDPQQTYTYLEGLSHKEGFFIVEFGGQPIGVIGLHLDWPHKLGETETWLGRPYWGQGLNTEAKVVLLDFAFGPWDLRRVQAIAHTQNLRSQRALEKLGFRREGLLRRWRWIRGEPWDFYMYSLLPEEWLTSRPAL